MTNEIEAPKSERLAELLPDITGAAGLGLLTRGLWVGWGEAVALSVCGVILLALAVALIVRGNR